MYKGGEERKFRILFRIIFAEADIELCRVEKDLSFKTDLFYLNWNWGNKLRITEKKPLNSTTSLSLLFNYLSLFDFPFIVTVIPIYY